MEIEIVGVADAGDLEKERLALKIVKSCDLGYFLVLDGLRLENGEVSTRVRQPYWFPDKKVKVGDRILLYTKKGVGPKQRTGDDGSTTYCFYRQLESTVWNRGGNTVLVLSLLEWISKRYGKAENQSEASAVS